MAKTGITYDDFMKAYKILEEEGQKITLRNLHARTGGSPNNVLKHWQHFKDEERNIALSAIDDELSVQVKKAMLAECARKTQSVRNMLQEKIKESGNQLEEVKGFLDESEKNNERLGMELRELQDKTQNKIVELEKKLSMAEQKAIDAHRENEKAEKRIEELKKQLSESQAIAHKAEIRAVEAETKNKHK